MKSDEEILRVVKKKFPSHEKRIDQLYEENADFRVLCTDWYTCVENIKKFKRSLNENGRLMDEFKELQDDLEKELNTFIY